MASVPLPLRRLLGAAVVSTLSLQGAAPPREEPVAAPPVLVTRDGASTRWSSPAQLAAAAEKGEPAAAFEYARRLEAGEGVDRDEAKALQYYQRAAAAGHRDALFRLGKSHHDGLLGLDVDYPRAWQYYRQAAAAGVPEAMFNLGSMLVSARGVKRDYVEGLAWLLVAQQHGAPAGPGIDQVKQRLAKRPQWIRQAEERALVLAEELKAGPATPAKAQPATTPPPSAAAPPGAAGRVEPPKVQLPAPRVELDPPAVSVPTPEPPK